MIVSWYEAVPSEDIPPRWMWEFAEDLNEHFDRIRANARNGRSEPDDDEPSGPMMVNELARRRGRNAG